MVSLRVAAERTGESVILGLLAGKVSVTPLVIDGIDYVVAVWPGEVGGAGDSLALMGQAADLGAGLLDGEVTQGWGL